ncbi:uncharacterized protein LOC128195640 [Vigna angularis]|uniref:uncharacterized protein LOC128195640 n=1 Tax=Phaseolus angularis TaxID=3914 RepID=UPI0022B4CE94|nr:uncharacterized protein LOC128195640 [Vigna angularis]
MVGATVKGFWLKTVGAVRFVHILSLSWCREAVMDVGCRESSISCFSVGKLLWCREALVEGGFQNPCIVEKGKNLSLRASVLAFSSKILRVSLHHHFTQSEIKKSDGAGRRRPRGPMSTARSKALERLKVRLYGGRQFDGTGHSSTSATNRRAPL